jgi:protein SCO1
VPAPPREGKPLLARTRRLVVVVPLLATVAALSGVLAFRRAPSLPTYWTLPDFRLVDQVGQPYGRADLAGGPWVAAFIFTRCGGTCPMMTARMARMQTHLPAGAKLVSITVDPSYDTREVLQAYARQAGAAESWRFLTGRQSDLYRLATDGFKLAAAETPAGQAAADEGPFLHSSKLTLVDAAGRVRGYYDSADDAAMARLRADLGRLAQGQE